MACETENQIGRAMPVGLTAMQPDQCERPATLRNPMESTCASLNDAHEFLSRIDDMLFGPGPNPTGKANAPTPILSLEGLSHQACESASLLRERIARLRDRLG